jgi:hypothetical protein
MVPRHKKADIEAKAADKTDQRIFLGVGSMMNPSATLQIETDSDLPQIFIELIRLRVLGRRVQATRRYLASPGSNIKMGHSCLDQTVTKLRAKLSHLSHAGTACLSDQPI